MTQDDLKLVLEALKWCHGGEPCGTAEAIAVVKKALAQPEQEPVAWWNDTGTHIDLNVSSRGTPLYTAPPQRTWVGLTDDEQQQVYEQWQNDGWGVFYNAIEARLKDKNS